MAENEKRELQAIKEEESKEVAEIDLKQFFEKNAILIGIVIAAVITILAASIINGSSNAQTKKQPNVTEKEDPYDKIRKIFQEETTKFAASSQQQQQQQQTQQKS